MRKAILVIFILLSLSALYLNIEYAKTKNSSSSMLFSSLNGIYFDTSLIENAQTRDATIKFIKTSNQPNLLTAIKNSKDPIGQFYALVALLNSSPLTAVEHIESLLLSQQKVNIIIDKNNKIQNSTLGYATLLVINRQPDSLLKSKLKDDFFKQLSPALLTAYKSKNKIDKNYKRELVYLIAQKSQNLLKEISKDIASTKPIEEMNEAEKIELSALLPALNKNEKEKIYNAFLNETNEQILSNTISSITENDSTLLSEKLLSIYNRTTSEDIKKIALDKYFLLAIKNRETGRLLSLMRNGTTNVIITGLNKIKEIGDDSFYDFLKLFLAPNYEDSVNILALRTILSTCYQTREQDVLRTLNYVLINIDKDPLAIEAIKLSIENKISSNSSAVLYRLKRAESSNNKSLKEIGMSYIETFNVTTAAQYLKELTADSDSEIRAKAENLLNTKFKNIVVE